MSAEVVHRLGTVEGAAALLVLLLLIVVPLVRWSVSVRRGRAARRRTASLLGAEAPPAAERRWLGRWSTASTAVRKLPVPAVVALAGWVVVGGATGALAGTAGAAGLWWWERCRAAVRPAEGFDEAEAARQLPLAADLVAACIAAGAGPVIAAQAVGEALGGPVGQGLARGAAEVRLGGEPSDAWRGLAAIPGAGALARLLDRADESGLPAAGPAARLAADVRADRARAATARARRAAVLVSAPVGLCFLPAFVAVGVLPVLIGLAGGLLSGGGG
ncbi:type II secretion system F family protein [Streptomyces sp. NPDC004065]|uniref:type II secretion system F family protein n=1 Tax=Streptomyces sp. NPDC004065 TaxID=3364689 RepID=UPI00384C5253